MRTFSLRSVRYLKVKVVLIATKVFKILTFYYHYIPEEVTNFFLIINHIQYRHSQSGILKITVLALPKNGEVSVTSYFNLNPIYSLPCSPGK
jgi:hypothetical protein